MGSLWGHIDEGIVFASLGLWWLYNLFKDYIKAGGRDKFVTQISYPTVIRGREIPVEIILKIFISVGGAVIEGVAVNFNIYDEDGNFIYPSTLQHISIFCLFFTHAVLDLLRYLNVLYTEGLEYFTMAASFLWYGTIFYYHTQYMTDMLESVVHNMGIIWCFGTGLSMMWELRTEDKFLPCYIKGIMVLSLGTWFIHTPFLLFSTDSFPGENENPRWERDSPENYQIAACFFGFHLCFNIIVSVAMYSVLCFFNKDHLSRKSVEFMRIRNQTPNIFTDENVGLLSEEEL